MPVRGEETRTFSLDSLFNHQSETVTDRRLTIEFTGNPSWYAVQALPSLALPTDDNAISWSIAYYANTLAAYIMKLGTFHALTYNTSAAIVNIVPMRKYAGACLSRCLSKSAAGIISRTRTMHAPGRQYP